MKSAKKTKFIGLGVIVILFILFTAFWASKKEGYFVDELYTYGLSNSYMTPFYERTEGYLDHYHKGTEFFEYLTVSEEDDWAFDSVWYNQEQDVHPPFYYMIFHMLSSIFKETVSPWIGIGINYFFFVLSAVVFYNISRTLFYTSEVKYISVIMFLFSAGMINCFLFIRMYMMLVFLILLYLWIMIKMFREDITAKKALLYHAVLVWVVVVGFLTHYYFIIPAVVISVIYIIYCMIQKSVKKGFYYILTCIAAGIISQYVFEYSFNHIFIGYRGIEAIRNIKNANFMENVGEMLSYVNYQLFGGLMYIIIGLLVVFSICCIYKKSLHKAGNIKKLKEYYKKNYKEIWTKGAIIITTVVFFVFVTKTAAPLSVKSRYLFPVYPFICIVFFIFMDKLTKTLKAIIRRGVLLTTTILCVALSYVVFGEPQFLFDEFAVVSNQIEASYKGTNAVYVTDCSYRYVSDSYMLSMHEDIYIADYSTVDSMSWFEDELIILYINQWAYEPAVGVANHDLEYYLKLARDAGYLSCEHLGNTEHSTVYLLRK